MSVYACADLHGRLDLFKQIQAFLNKDDTLYVLGDVIDRGSDGWELFKEVMKDSRCKLLKGNHEDMCFKAMNDAKYGNYQDNISIWFINGGDITFDQILADENGFDIYPLMKDLILETEYLNKDGMRIILNHSGFYDENKTFPWGNELLWDRTRYKRDFAKGWLGPENVIVVHGHTPIPLLVKELQDVAEFYQKEPPVYEDGAFWYADNHKVCLDMGSVWSNKTVVLDLDTFDEHIFEIVAGEKNGQKNS